MTGSLHLVEHKSLPFGQDLDVSTSGLGHDASWDINSCKSGAKWLYATRDEQLEGSRLMR